MASQNLIDYFEKLKNLIEQNGVTKEYVDILIKTANVAFTSENDIEFGLKVTGYAKQCCESMVAANGYTLWELEKYCFANNTSYELISTWYEVLKLEAQHMVLDSYFLYLERKREPSERFYAPKRKHLLKLGLIGALQDMLDDKLDILSISMPPGTQKCQPLYSKVLTPNGFTTMGELKVGDNVIAANGNVAKVLSMSPIKPRDIYELTFDDGSKCRCSDNHLWKVQTRDDRRRKNKDGSEKYRIVELQDMLGNYKLENGKRCNYSIDYVPKIDFEEKELKIHPYVMGALLGDGCFTNGRPDISTIDMQIVDTVNDFLPKGYCLKHRDRCTYSVYGHEGNNAKNGSLITQALKYYGLYKHKSIDKFIPKDYMYASYEQRLWLLRGLLDTDGNASKSCCRYASISKELAENVVELVHSLGGYASMQKVKAGYKRNGEYKRCNDCYNVTMQFPSGIKVFNLDRKNEVYKPKRKVIKRFITDIKYIEKQDCRCIYISDSSHLYITDNYIITHNTTLEKFFNSGVIGWFPKDFNLFFSHSGDIARMYYDGVLDIVNNADEYCWNEIFPDLKVTSTNAKMQQFNVGKYKPFPSLQTTSVGSENAGKVRASKFLLCDDLIGKLEEALNKNTLDKLWNVYSVDARQRKLDGCKEIHIATRWSVHDVIGRLQNLYEGSERCRFIAVPDIDPDTGESNFDYEFMGFTKEFFMDQELAMDDISYRCLYKNDPIEREGLLYHEDDVRRYVSLPDREPDAIIGVCDTKSTGVDYMVLPVFYQYDNDYYLVDCICDNGTDFGSQIENISNIIVRHKMQQCEFESNAGGSRLAYDVEKVVRDKNGFCNITTKATESNKETRIIVNSDWIKRNCLFKCKEDYSVKSDYGIFMNFMFSYSVAGKNKFDDVVDCLSLFKLFVERSIGCQTVIMKCPF